MFIPSETLWSRTGEGCDSQGKEGDPAQIGEQAKTIAKIMMQNRAKHLNRKRVNDSRHNKRKRTGEATPATQIEISPPTLAPKLAPTLAPNIFADWDFAAKQAYVFYEGETLKTAEVRPVENNRDTSQVLADFRFRDKVLTMPIASIWWGIVSGQCSSSSADPCFRSVV